MKDYVTNKELFDAIKYVRRMYRDLTNGSDPTYTKDFMRGVDHALDRLQVELGYLPQMLIKDRDY